MCRLTEPSPLDFLTKHLYQEAARISGVMVVYQTGFRCDGCCTNMSYMS